MLQVEEQQELGARHGCAARMCLATGAKRARERVNERARQGRLHGVGHPVDPLGRRQKPLRPRVQPLLQAHQHLRGDEKREREKERKKKELKRISKKTKTSNGLTLSE